MLRLPNEVIVYILQNLYYIDDNWEAHGKRDDILATRGVCRRLADVGAPLAFRHVHVTQDPKGFQRLFALSNSNHRSSVQMLTYGFEDFSSEIVPEEEIVRYMTPEYGEIDLSEKRQELYEQYYVGSTYQFQLHEHNLDVAYLSAAFGLLENLQSIRISQHFTSRSGPWAEDGLFPHDLADFLQLATSYRILDTVSAALCAAASKVKALTLLSSPSQFGGDWPLIALIEGLSFSKIALYRQAFTHLQAVNICLPSDDAIYPINFEGLEDFLCSLPALTELVLTGAAGEPVQLLHPTRYLFASGMHLSRLQDIKIKNVVFESATHLTEFVFRHSDTLRQVRLHRAVRHELPWDDSWEKPLTRIRGTLNLNIIQNYEGICIYTAEDDAKEKSWFQPKVSGRSCRACIEDFMCV